MCVSSKNIFDELLGNFIHIFHCIFNWLNILNV